MLTSRQREVLGLRARGLTDKQVGDMLGISEETVKDHAREARLSLGARNTTHAVWLALNSRLIVP